MKNEDDGRGADMEMSDDEELSEGYEQWEGEPDKWYARFRQFCELGSARSLLRCYQVVMAARDALENRKTDGARRQKVPEVWRKRAGAFDWKGRAKAWDKEKQDQAVMVVEETLVEVSHDAPEVRQFYKNLMRGWIRSPDGEMVPVKDIYQRRMAAKALQNWAGMARRAFLENEEEEVDVEDMPIREVRAHEPEDDAEEEDTKADE